MKTKRSLLDKARGRLKRPLWRAWYRTTGKRLQSEAIYLDSGLFEAVFEADVARVGERLPEAVVPIEHRPGRVEVSVTAFDHRAVDILEPYQELGVSVPVVSRVAGHEGLAGHFVLYLPVSTEDARWPGVANYGFPKVLGDIVLTERGDANACRLAIDGEHVLTLTVPRVELEEEPVLVEQRNLTVLRGLLIESTFTFEGLAGEVRERGGATLQLGGHAMAYHLGQLGISTRSVRHLEVPRMRALLSRARALGPAVLLGAEPHEHHAAA